MHSSILVQLCLRKLTDKAFLTLRLLVFFRASQALPSRDAKATHDPEAVLKEQYDAFFQVISEERRLQE